MNTPNQKMYIKSEKSPKDTTPKSESKKKAKLAKEEKLEQEYLKPYEPIKRPLARDVENTEVEFINNARTGNNVSIKEHVGEVFMRHFPDQLFIL